MSPGHDGAPDASGGTCVAPGVGRAERLAVAAAFTVFTVLAWGLFAPDRGFLQDEPWLLASMRDGRAGAWGWLWPGRTLQLTPQRPLQGLPFALALWTPYPRLALQLFYGAAWLASGLAASCVIRRLRPGRPVAAFVAGALVLSATGDHALGNLAYLSAWIAAAAWAVAFAALVVWERGGDRRALALSLTALAFGLLTYDGIVAAAVATPPLLWGLRDPGGAPATARRRILGATAWGAVVLPYLALFMLSLRNAGSYAAQVLEWPPPAAWLASTTRLFALNLTPWRWSGVFVRPEDGTTAALLPPAWRLGLAGAGALVFVAVTRRLASRRAPDRPPAPSRGNVRAVAMLLLAALFASAAVALASGFAHRTQLVPRVFVSLALALAADAAAQRLAPLRPRLAWLPWALPAAFVAFGLHAGLVGQDYLLTLWRRHRAELRSILDQAPGLAPDAWLVLRVPPGAPFTSMHYPEVGGPWLDYLYGAAPKVMPWHAGGPFECSLVMEGFECRNRRRAACYASGECRPYVLPIERAVVLDYVTASGRFELRRRLPPDVLAQAAPEVAESVAARYAPDHNLRARPRTRAARELLDDPEWLGHFIPGPPRPTGR